jgi:hypothetical protein
VGYSETIAHEGNGAGTSTVACVSGPGSASSGRRSGKELLQELGTEEEKKAIVINMAQARRANRGRFLAVGVFLSVIAITSKNLIDSMRKVWQIRGFIETHQLADRRFVIEFSEEGDFTHVTKGGPWRYKEDAVLVDVLKEGDDPETVRFTTVPIWVQFRKIPFYLLSKKLAKELGEKIGEFICIDNNARGDICDKIIRTRVHLPIDRALRRWIPLIDEIENEQVVAFVHYERLPTFCYTCGFIGHKYTECMVAGNTRKKTYKAELGVMPILPEDDRKWFLPDTTSHVRQAPSLPWRTSRHTPSKQNPERGTTTIARIATAVGKLSVNDNLIIDFPSTKNTIDSTKATSPSSTPPAASGAKQGTTSATPPEGLQQVPATQAVVTAGAHAPPPPAAKQGSTSTMPTAGSEGGGTGSQKGGATWIRYHRRKENAKIVDNTTRTTQGFPLGASRPRANDEEEDQVQQPLAKRIIMQVPPLEHCLGKEGLEKIRQEEHGLTQLGGQEEEVENQKAKGTKEKSYQDTAANSNGLNALAEPEGGEANLAVQLNQQEEVADNTDQIKEKKKKMTETSRRSEGRKPGAKECARQIK